MTPPASGVGRLVRIALVAVACAVLASALMLFNDVPELRRAAPAGAWPPSIVTRVLMLPLPSTGMTDVRWYALPTGLAFVLLLVAIHPTLARSNNSKPDQSTTLQGFATRFWFELLAAGVILIALASAFANQTWEFSRGWCCALITGCAWCTLLKHTLSHGLAKSMLIAALWIASVAAALAVWHRLALGEPFFELPIGPVTATGSLGAMMIAVGSAWLFALLIARDSTTSRSPITALLPVVLCILIGLFMTILAARRGSWVALAAVLFILGLVTITRGVPRRRIAGLLAAGLILMIIAGAVIQQRYIAPRIRAGKSFEGRLNYWSFIVSEIPIHPLIGAGPDSFVCDMTSANALRHSTRPKAFSGRVDYEAHNEWLQVFHELGIAGGLCYLGMPCGVIILSLRRWRRAPRDPKNCPLLASAAGLIAILVYESASINMRHPVMLPWYWTLLGITMAMLNEPASEPADGKNRNREPARLGSKSDLPVIPSVMIRVTALALAITVIATVISDARCAMAHESARIAQPVNPDEALQHYERALSRAGSRNWLSVRADRASLLSQLAAKQQSASDNEAARRAAEAWQVINEQCPGYPAAGYRQAEALLRIGNRTDSLAVLNNYLEKVDPYDPQANLLRIYLGGQDAMQNLISIRRALFSSPMNNMLATLASREFASPQTSQPWAKLVHEAWESAGIDDDESWTDPLAPETLRLEALRLAGAGELPQATRVSRLAADMYARQYAELSDLRRMNAPVGDAWYLAARFLFESEPARYREAFEAVLKAEEYAKLEVQASASGIDLNPVLLRNRSPELRLLLRFSAMMGLAVGMADIEISRRVNWSLPGDQHSMEQVSAEICRLAADLVAIFERMPAASQPPTMSALRQMASRAVPQPP